MSRVERPTGLPGRWLRYCERRDRDRTRYLGSPMAAGLVLAGGYILLILLTRRGGLNPGGLLVLLGLLLGAFAMGVLLERRHAARLRRRYRLRCPSCRAGLTERACAAGRCPACGKVLLTAATGRESPARENRSVEEPQ